MQNLGFALIDPHIHQWDPYHTPHAAALAVKLLGKQPFLLDKMVRLVKPKDLIETVGLTTHITRPYLPLDYKQDAAHYAVEQVVHIEASWADHKGKGVVDETTFIESLPFNTETVQLGGIVATADPCHSNFRQILKLHQKASKRLRGIRRMAAWHEDKGVHNWTAHEGLYTSKKFLKGFEQLAQLNLSFDAWVYSHQIPDVIELAKRFPETSIVLDHLGTPAGLFGKVGQNTGLTETARQNIFYQWQDYIAELSTYPNVYTKMSGLFMPVLGHQFYKQKKLASKQQIIDLVAPIITHTLDSFGNYRVMFASNFPMDRVNASLVNLIDAFSDVVQQYDERALENIFHHNARQFYRL